MNKRHFKLPPAIADLIRARDSLREHYGNIALKFTLDGNLVGDLGEAIAVELFGVELEKRRSTAGIDGSVGGRTVQVKATGTGRGPAFRRTETKADHLLFFDLDLERAVGTIVFNGPDRIATQFLPAELKNQRMISACQIRRADEEVLERERLPIVRLDLMLDQET